MCEVEDVTVAEGRSVNGKRSFNSQDDGGKKVLEIHINALVFKVFSLGSLVCCCFHLTSCRVGLVYINVKELSDGVPFAVIHQPSSSGRSLG